MFLMLHICLCSAGNLKYNMTDICIEICYISITVKKKEAHGIWSLQVVVPVKQPCYLIELDIQQNLCTNRF